MSKVLISDSLSAAAVDIFKANGIETNVITGMKPEELIACIGPPPRSHLKCWKLPAISR